MWIKDTIMTQTTMTQTTTQTTMTQTTNWLKEVMRHDKNWSRGGHSCPTQ